MSPQDHLSYDLSGLIVLFFRPIKSTRLEILQEPWYGGVEAGQTSLMLASRGGHEAVVKLLLEAGADVASADCSGQTSLGLASRAGHEAVVKLLLDAGADRTLLEQPSLEERNELDFGECLLLLALMQQGHRVEVRIPE